MARRHAMPKALGHIHPRFRTPDVSTWTVAVIATVWYLVVNLLSENALFDSLTALSLLIAFYYALTGLACAIYYRRELTESAKNFLLIGVGPVVGVDPAVLVAGRVDHRHGGPGELVHRRRLAGRGATAGHRCLRSSSSASSSWSSGGSTTAGTGRRSRGWPTRCWRRAARIGRRRRGDGPMTIVLGYDESPGARRALDQAVDIAARMNETLVWSTRTRRPVGWARSSPPHVDALAEQGAGLWPTPPPRRGRPGWPSRSNWSRRSRPRPCWTSPTPGRPTDRRRHLRREPACAAPSSAPRRTSSCTGPPGRCSACRLLPRRIDPHIDTDIDIDKKKPTPTPTARHGRTDRRDANLLRNPILN